LAEKAKPHKGCSAKWLWLWWPTFRGNISSKGSGWIPLRSSFIRVTV
jgi:hypothetical protein